MAYTTTPEDNEYIANLPGDIRAVTAVVTAHTDATSAAHAASAISYGTSDVETALDTAAGHEANQDNPHGVTAAQAAAVALEDAVTTATAGKVVMRDSNGKVVGDITGNAATATSATTAVTCTGNAATATLASDSSLLEGYTAEQVAALAPDVSSTYTGSTQATISMLYNTSSSNTADGTMTTSAGVSSGTYALSAVLQSLVTLSHKHTAVVPTDCNCSY